MSRRISYNKLFLTLLFYFLLNTLLPDIISLGTHNRDVIVLFTYLIPFMMVFLSMGKEAFMDELKEKREKVSPFMLLVLLLAPAGFNMLGRFANLGARELFALVGFQPLEVNAQIAQLVVQTPSLFLFFNLCILAPFMEEFVARNFLYRGIEEPKPWLAVFLSGVLFALMHGNLDQSIGVFFFGVYFSYLAMRFSMWLPIAAHVVNNLYFYAINWIMASKPTMLPYVGGTVTILGGLAFLIVLIEGISYVKKQETHERKKAEYLKSPWFWACIAYLGLMIVLFEIIHR